MYDSNDALLPLEPEVEGQRLASVPWWMISIAVHSLLVTLTMLVTWQAIREEKITAFSVHPLSEDLPPPPEDPLEIDESPVDLDEIEISELVRTERPDAQSNESADDEDQKLKGDPDALSDSDFKGPSVNSAAGLGPGGGGRFGDRIGGRNRRVGENGGQGTQTGVLLGLRWLADHQDPATGRWDSDDFQSQCKTNTCSGRGAEWCDVGQTGLALLAFLGAGNTHMEGPFKETVKKAVRYLQSVQELDGCFGPRRGHFLYNHAIAALAMVEAHGMVCDRSSMLGASAQKGIDFLVAAQNPGSGWRYSVQPGASDTSVTGWAVMALKSARVAELRVPREAFEGAKNWLDSVTDSQYYRTGYMQPGDAGARLDAVKDRFASAESATAISVMSRIFMGADCRDPLVAGQGDLLAQCLPQWDTNGGPNGTSRIDFYYWYYGSLAMFQLGDDHWKTWNPAMKNAIVKHQRVEGDERGSWDPIDAWGTEGGRVYATAMNVLSLEIYYRYGRILK